MSSPARSTRESCTQVHQRAPRLNASRFRAYLKIVYYTIYAGAAAPGRATGNAYRVVAALGRIVGRHAAHEGGREARWEERHSGSACHHANPSFVREAAAGIVRRIHCNPASTLVGTSARGTAGSGPDDEEAVDAAPRHGVGDRRRMPAGATSSTHTRRGGRDWSRGTHSWQGWPTPAHSPIRPPPSTRRVIPANDSAVEYLSFDDDRSHWRRSGYFEAFFNFVAFLFITTVEIARGRGPRKKKQQELGDVSNNFPN